MRALGVYYREDMEEKEEDFGPCGLDDGYGHPSNDSPMGEKSPARSRPGYPYNPTPVKLNPQQEAKLNDYLHALEEVTK